MRITKSLEITHDVAIDVNVHDVITELAALKAELERFSVSANELSNDE